MKQPKKPENLSYLNGWFLVQFKGDQKKARRAARLYHSTYTGEKK